MLTSLGELPDDVVLEKPSDEVARAPKDEDDAALLPPYVAEGPSTDVLARQLHLFVPRPRSVLETELTCVMLASYLFVGNAGSYHAIVRL